VSRDRITVPWPQSAAGAGNNTRVITRHRLRPVHVWRFAYSNTTSSLRSSCSRIGPSTLARERLRRARCFLWREPELVCGVHHPGGSMQLIFARCFAKRSFSLCDVDRHPSGTEGEDLQRRNPSRHPAKARLKRIDAGGHLKNGSSVLLSTVVLTPERLRTGDVMADSLGLMRQSEDRESLNFTVDDH
jgi:hypothetical protein